MNTHLETEQISNRYANLVRGMQLNKVLNRYTGRGPSPTFSHHAKTTQGAIQNKPYPIRLRT